MTSCRARPSQPHVGSPLSPRSPLLNRLVLGGATRSEGDAILSFKLASKEMFSPVQ